MSREPELIRMGLVCEWYCVPEDMTQPEQEAFIVALIERTGRDQMALDAEIVRDRLYGGFGCEKSDRRHVCYATGQYTYLGPNRRVTPEERAEAWNSCFVATPPEHRGDGKGPFTEDRPNV